MAKYLPVGVSQKPYAATYLPLGLPALAVSQSRWWHLVNNCKAPFTQYNPLSIRLSIRLSNRFDKRLYRVYSRLSNWLYNRFDNRVERTAVRSTRLSNHVCQTGLTNTVWQLVERTVLFVQHGCHTGCLDNRLYRVYKHSTGCQTGLTTSLTTGWMFVYTIQPVFNPVVQPVWQPVVSCKRGLRI